MNSRKVKVISDGTAFGTSIVDAETGQLLQLPITKLSWSIDANQRGLVMATLDVEFIGIEIVSHFSEAMIEEYVLRLSQLLVGRRQERKREEADIV